MPLKYSSTCIIPDLLPPLNRLKFYASFRGETQSRDPELLVAVSSGETSSSKQTLFNFCKSTSQLREIMVDLEIDE
jgi:hypothetical protein